MPKWLRRIIALVGASLVVLVIAVGVLVYINGQRPTAEFDSVQDVGDHITGFYSVALDRADITEGAFTLGVVPGRKIVIETAAPLMEGFIIRGTRKVQYSDDGMRIFVQTAPDQHLLGLNYDDVFSDITSTLRVLWIGEEIEVPIALNFFSGSDRIDITSDTAQALLALDGNESHRYVVEVVESRDIRNLAKGRDSTTGQPVSESSMIANALTPDALKDSFGIRTNNPYIPFIALRGFMAGIEEYATNDAWEEKSLSINIKYRQLRWENERINELTESFPDWTDEDRAEFAQIEEELVKEATISAVREMGWLQLAIDRNITSEVILALAERLTFEVQLHVLSIDGIDVSG